MSLLILGLAVFLGVHSIRMVAPDWRERMIRQVGLLPWKGLYALVSLLGLIGIIYGYGEAHMAPVVLWQPPLWTRHLAALLMLLAFICVAAAYIPHNWIKARFGHPMLAGVKTWGFAHLIANGTLADVVLFGSFMIWAILEYRVHRLRDRAAGVVYRRGHPMLDVIVVLTGAAATGVFALFLHLPLIGVRPF